jgi:hypothetical protein
MQQHLNVQMDVVLIARLWKQAPLQALQGTLVNPGTNTSKSAATLRYILLSCKPNVKLSMTAEQDGNTCCH